MYILYVYMFICIYYMYMFYVYKIYIYMLGPPMYLPILVCFIEHIAIYATTLMGRGTMYDKYFRSL